jgi:delta24-sterol reductase
LVGNSAASRGGGGISFLEGLGFSDDYFATIEGRYVSDPSRGTPRRHCNGYGDKWFYNQVKDALDDVSPGDSASGDVRTLVYDTKSYLFRHDRGSFWMASYRIPQPVAQYLMGPLLDSSNMFLLATMLPWAFPKHQIVLQDFMLPRNTVCSFFERMQKVTPLYPVWLLPMRNVPCGALFAAPGPFEIAASTDAWYDSSNEEVSEAALADFRKRERSMHMMNVGAYGIPKGNYVFEEANRHLESLLVSHGGRKVFYSHAFFDDKTFYDSLYDGERYFKLREKYGAEGALPEIFEKVVTKSGKL